MSKRVVEPEIHTVHASIRCTSEGTYISFSQASLGDYRRQLNQKEIVAVQAALAQVAKHKCELGLMRAPELELSPTLRVRITGARLSEADQNEVLSALVRHTDHEIIDLQALLAT